MFNIKPGQDLFDVLLGLKDVVLVHGDTSFYCKIKVEAGDIYSPWPEEANTGVLANYHFAPTSTSQKI